MKKLLFFCLALKITLTYSQVDYTDRWEDFFSYNNVKDVAFAQNQLYAIADNAVFTYNFANQETEKISSVNGLSGEATSAVYYDPNLNRLIIGYQNGLIEIVNEDRSIRVSPDILNFTQSGEKSINHISANGSTLYLSTPFAIVEYDLENLEFGSTFFIGPNSQALRINKTIIVDNDIYAATENGLYQADLSNPNLIDFNNWSLLQAGNFSSIEWFNNTLFLTSNNNLQRFSNGTLTTIRSFSSNIISVESSTTNLVVSESTSAHVFDQIISEIATVSRTTDYSFTLNSAFINNGQVYLATQQYGVLNTTISTSNQFTEIHPEGPLSNDVFSLTAKENNLWVVYGGYSGTFAVSNTQAGYSHFNGESWINTPYDNNNPIPDLVDVTFDPENINRVYISSFGDTGDVSTRRTGGLMAVENDVITEFYNQANSGLEDIFPNDPNRVTVRVSGSVFDNQGNLWVTNIGVSRELKKFANGAWTSYDISSVKFQNSFGLYEIVVDRANNIWIGSRNDGAIVFNENGSRLRSLTTTSTQGSLPSGNVRTIAVDNNNRIWIGTLSGLVVFNNANNVFNAGVVDAEPIIFSEDGIARRLLGDQTVNSIVVDGADNKWFGTDNGGVVYTSPNGETTLATFSRDNSPLPSNRIVKITVDENNGKVFFATDKGVVAYNSNVSPFGETLGAIYAYPNPVRNFHNTVTIDGRNGTHLPRGTNVKIVDVAGNLVFETNVIEGQELQGGKVVWDKKNLAGKPVASGIYIVLLSNDDASETTTTKIAIIN